MFGKRVVAVIWNEMSRQSGDKRTRFVAYYLFDDGFSSLSECKQNVPEPEKWAYVCFCDNWYAVNSDSYHRTIIATKENIILNEDEIEIIDKIPPYLSPHRINQRLWMNGIYLDLETIDSNLKVVDSDGHFPDPVTISNTIVTFGIPCFISEICIRRDTYAKHILTHYFNDRSLECQLEEIKELRDEGYEYWNPFNGERSSNEKEHRRNKRTSEKGIDMGPIINNRIYIGDVRCMNVADEIADYRAQTFYKPYRRTYRRKRW